MIAQTFSNAWSIYRARFGLIAAIVATIWIPCNLADSYLTYFVIDADDFLTQLKLTTFLENFIGIIATAGVTFIALNTDSERKTTYGEALGTGFRSWGRMWITRFLFSLAVGLGLVLLIIPGVYLAVRFAFAEAAVIAEGTSGPAALRRSYELTRGRFWPVFGLISLCILLFIPLLVVSVLVAYFIPALDHWLINAGELMLFNIAAAFLTVVFVSGYQILTNQNNDEPPALPLTPAATSP